MIADQDLLLTDSSDETGEDSGRWFVGKWVRPAKRKRKRKMRRRR